MSQLSQPRTPQQGRDDGQTRDLAECDEYDIKLFSDGVAETFPRVARESQKISQCLQVDKTCLSRNKRHCQVSQKTMSPMSFECTMTVKLDAEREREMTMMSKLT
jgi:hypothetical protein